jgi:hypothetical protein
MAEGSSERAIRDENDELIRKILRKRDSGCINEDCTKWSGLHPGHYISRKVLALRWLLDQVWLQCDFHNAAHNEDPKPYRRALVVKVGLDRVREIEAIGKKNPELAYVDLLAIRDELRAELKRWK